MPEPLAPAAIFVERLGLAAESDGLPRIAGRILGLFFVEDRPLRFDELAELLRVSRASVSTNTRLLESVGLIERFTVPGDRRDFFRLGHDPYGRLLEGYIDRLRRVEQIVDDCVREHPGSAPPGRLATMKRFYTLAIRNTEEVLERWRREGLRESEEALGAGGLDRIVQ